MYILGNKFNSKAQQIDENTKDIAELKEIVKTPAIIYDASVEISTDAGTVNSSDIIQTIGSIENAFILDTVGSLFRIIEVVENTIYIMYVSTIRGEKGDTGENGENGDNGVSIVDVKVMYDEIDHQNHLIVYLSDDTEIDAGAIELPDYPTIEYGTATNNTSFINNGVVNWTKFGNVVFVNLQDVKFNNTAIVNNDILFSDLPKSVSQEVNILIPYGALGSSKYSRRISIKQNSTSIINHYNDFTESDTSQAYFGTLIYTCE